MKRLAACAALLTVGVLVGSPGGAAAATGDVTVGLDRTALTVRTGDRFVFHSTVRNTGGQPTPDVLAHLEIASLDRSVYVDPEDWSGARTRYLGRLEPGESTRVTWRVQAVGAGRFLLFVSTAEATGTAAVSSSRPLRLEATEQRTLSGGGVLPVVTTVPAGLLVLTGLAARRRRRLR